MSDNITKRVGLGTAYGFAKAGGYEGTVAEFTELLGNIAIDLARIENLSVTVTTLPAGSQATASLNGSVLSLGIPKGDKGDKGDTGETGAPAGFGTVSATVDSSVGTPSVEVTASGADTAKNFAFAFHNLKGQKGDKGDTGEVSEAELTQAFEDFSENGTVANAEQLTTDIKANDQSPYLFRTSGGSVDIGDREYINGIVGGTIAWNQLVSAMRGSGSEKGLTFTRNADDSLDISGTITEAFSYNYVPFTFTGLNFKRDGRKYLLMLNKPIPYEWGVGGYGSTISANSIGGMWSNNAGTDWSNGLIFRAEVGTTIDIQNLRAMLIDLTAMFGSTIADYIYGLEQSSAGAGVAWFKKLFPKPYYAYNSGELMSVKGLVSHDMTGFNQWDEEWENGTINGQGQNASGTAVRAKNYVPILPSTSYYITPVMDAVFWYDADKNFISPNYSGGVKTSPNNAHYMRFYTQASYGTTYKNDICINLSWDGERDGNYEPYQKWSYPLDSDLELRGIPKIENGNLYYDGDVYEPDGTVTRKYGVAVLNGTQTPMGSSPSSNPNGGYNVWFTYANAGMGDAKLGTVDIPKLSDKFMYVPRQPSGSGDPQNTIPIGSFSGNTLNLDGYIVFAFGSEYDTFAKIHAWFASHPTTVVYELATPTTETADPYQATQIVNDFGTEEFVISNTVDVPIPVGNNTDYPINLKAKVEMMPNSPDGGGDYIVRQTNGTNEYVAFANNATIQNILARLEALEG